MSSEFGLIKTIGHFIIYLSKKVIVFTEITLKTINYGRGKNVPYGKHEIHTAKSLWTFHLRKLIPMKSFVKPNLRKLFPTKSGKAEFAEINALEMSTKKFHEN